MIHEATPYGLWSAVAVSFLALSIVALGFRRRQLVHDRRPFGAVIIVFSLPLRQPAILTLLTFPLLVSMYMRSARRDDTTTLRGFGSTYAACAAATLARFPRMGSVPLHRPLKGTR